MNNPNVQKIYSLIFVRHGVLSEMSVGKGNAKSMRSVTCKLLQYTDPVQLIPTTYDIGHTQGGELHLCFYALA